MSRQAVIATGGKQYLVTERQKLKIEKLDVPAGTETVLDKVLLVVDGSAVTVGQPYVPGAQVKAKVLQHARDRKIIVVKYKPKVRYRRKQGHRQTQTQIEITGITTSA